MKPAFWTYFTAALFFNFGFSLFFFLFNVYLFSLGYNEQALGLIGSFALIGRLAGTLPTGYLAQRFGLRATLTTAIAITLAATFARITFTTHTAQLALAAIVGLTLSAWGVCLPPAIAALTTEARRPFAFSLIFASGIGDAGLGAYAAGHLPTYATQRTVLYLGAAIAALSLPFLLRLKIPRENNEEVSFRVTCGRRETFRFSNFLPPFLLATAPWAIVLGAFPPFANVFFTHHLQVPLAQMGSILSIAQAAPFLAVLLSPFLFKYLGLRNGILLTQLLTAATLLTLGAAHTVFAASVSYWLYSAAQNSNEPALASLLMDRVPANARNTASSTTSLTTAAVQIPASTAVGYGIVHFGYTPVLTTIAALALIAAFLFFRLPQPHPTST